MLDSKVILVTGASSDIGMSIVEKLLAEGAKVIAHYHSNPISITNPNLSIIKYDLSKLEDTNILFEEAIAIHGKIEILICCAGLIENKNILEIETEDMIKIFSVNLFSHIILMQKVFENMVERKFGRIISLSSIGVKYAGSKQSVLYSSSKAALEAVTKSFAKFGAEYNVLSNNIRVGVIDTKIHKGKNLEERKKLIPLQRLGKPEDISDFVLYLCSSKAGFITGQDFSISGGE